MRRIGPLHWQIGSWHFGIHQHGNCWTFKPSVDRYSTCTFYTFWRFFVSRATRKP